MHLEPGARLGSYRLVAPMGAGGMGEAGTSVWTGDQMSMGEKSGSRDTFVKKSETEYAHKYELNTKGQWSLILDETCRKAGAAKAAP